MAFPAGPYTDGQTHTEAGVNYTYSAATGGWLKNAAGIVGGNVPATRAITGATSLAGGGDLTADRTVSLVNDVVTPGTFNYYGTNAAGVKGWHVISAAQTSRNILTTNSVTGGGNLTVDRTLQLVNDSAAPGDNMVYGTNGAGVRGWQQALNAVPETRSITGTVSITGGGDLTINRTLSLVNDVASPGNNKMYGTDASGVKGWVDGPRPITYASGQINATQTVAAGGFYQIPIAASGLTVTADAVTLVAGATYTIDVNIFGSGGAPLRLKVVDRTSNVDLATFRSATTVIFKPTVNTQVSVQNDETTSVAGPIGYVSIFNV